MKKFFLGLLLIAGLLFNPCKAQYVTIPDAGFVSWLQANGYAACLTGNQLDTTCGAVLTATSMVCSNVTIGNLSGIQYFKAIHILDCSNDSIYAIPPLPASVTTFNCSYNYLSALPVLPAHLNTLNCSYNFLTVITTLPSSLQQLTCTNNQIRSLPVALPNTLLALWCDFNNLDSLPSLPGSLTDLSCAYNFLHRLPALPGSLLNLICYSDSLSALPTLPAGLATLNCNLNELSSLPVLPTGLTSLQCADNNLTHLPALPATLQSLYCLKNQLNSLPALPATLILINCNSNLFTSMPSMPASLQIFECAFNHLTSIPVLPPRLQILDCSYNQLSGLPALPSTLTTLYCNSNHLVSLPDIPSSLTEFNCGFNQLTSIPSLPDSLHSFLVTYNTNLSCLPELKRIVNLDFRYTAITCLPDRGHVTSSIPSLDTLPLCYLFNATGCPVFWNISGQCYDDQNNDCRFDSIDVGSNNIKTLFYNNGDLLQQVFTGSEGSYSFQSPGYGNYMIRVDTSSLPFTLNCPDSGFHSVTLSAGDSISYSNNFAFKCSPQGFDIGVQTLLNDYHTPRPGAVFSLRAIAGDLSQLYGAGCASGVSGTVQLIYSGPVHYMDTASGAIAPTTITGDTLNWTISDFGRLNDYRAFNLLFKTDSLAKTDTSLCFTVSVTPTAGDFKTANNSLTYCIPVVDSLGGNEKEVYPLNSLDTSKPWLTYTIRFQNKDTTIAHNLVITDTLDSHLDPSTFQLLTSSAKNITQIFNNVVMFNFPNIDLPDSHSSDSLSRGYIQYKIKLRDSLPLGTQIHNTAYIQFDTGAVIITNTTTDSLVADTVKPKPTGIINVNTGQTMLTLYPNPAHDYITVSVSNDLLGSWLELSDAVGRIISHQQITNDKLRLQTGGLAKGVYLVRVIAIERVAIVKKLVVE